MKNGFFFFIKSIIYFLKINFQSSFSFLGFSHFFLFQLYFKKISKQKIWYQTDSWKKKQFFFNFRIFRASTIKAKESLGIGGLESTENVEKFTKKRKSEAGNAEEKAKKKKLKSKTLIPLKDVEARKEIEGKIAFTDLKWVLIRKWSILSCFVRKTAENLWGIRNFGYQQFCRIFIQSDFHNVLRTHY